MCGIAGILHFQEPLATQAAIQQMTKALAHRGPDAEGYYLRDQIALGHRRLSIIDLEGGAQPMSNRDQNVAISYNGELYNFRQLRAELKSLGYSFQTESDTEVVLHAWEAWQEACVQHFRGMFAFAIADWPAKKLFLARDHFGIKPLYYFRNERLFAFASEIQALRTLPSIPKTIDPQALDQYLFLGYVPSPKTIYQGVSKLPHAHSLTIPFHGRRSHEPERYWALEFKPETEKTAEEWTTELERTIRDSVRAHLVSDVPFGAFLSGGVDSSLIVSLMAQESDRQVTTFSIGFEEDSHNELPFGNEVARKWKTEHHTKIVRPDAAMILPKLMQHHGEPFADASSVPTYYLSELAREFVPMVLSGDGGDESFAGYYSYPKWLAALYRNQPFWKKALSFPNTRITEPNHPTKLSRSLQSWYRCMVGRVMDSPTRSKLWRREYRPWVDLPVESFETAFQESQRFSPLSQGQYMDFETYLPNWILAKEDIASMMHGLEVRTPLVDVRVAELLTKIPSDLTLYLQKNGFWIGKYLLKRVLSPYFSDRFIDRPKQGFVPPAKHWFETDTQFRKEATHRLARKNAALHEYLEPKAIMNLIDDDPEKTWHQLWSLLCLESWFETALPR